MTGDGAFSPYVGLVLANEWCDRMNFLAQIWGGDPYFVFGPDPFNDPVYGIYMENPEVMVTRLGNSFYAWVPGWGHTRDSSPQILGVGRR